MFKLLVADDEENIRNLFKLRLESEGFEVFTARNGAEAMEILYKEVIDLLIADVMMPVIDGFALVKRMREENFEIPVIMLTAKGLLEDKKTGFAAGADDYNVKPIEFDELLLRMKALFRRAKIVTEKKIVAGDTELNFSTLSIVNNKRSVSITLSKKEFQILYKLLSYPERTFTKWQLYDEFWGMDCNGDTDAVKVYISKIRTAIEPFPEIDIQTIRGIGYRGVRNETN